MTRPSDSFSNIPSETKVLFLFDVTVRFMVEIYLQFSVRLGRALNPGEYRVKLYLLRMGEIEVRKNSFLLVSIIPFAI